MRQSFRPRPRGRTCRPVKTVGDLTREFFGLAAESSQVFLSGAFDLAQRTPTMRLPRQRKVCEPDCYCYEEPEEPECCEVDCHAYVGEILTVPIRVVNRSDQTVSFAATATPWRGAGGDSPGETIALDPDNFTLSPNQSIIVAVGFRISNEFRPGSSYRADVILRSEEGEDRVCLRVDVSAIERAACEIEHTPHKVHARRCHHWSDHFYCERPKWHRYHK